jgi:hypothetical protein
MRIIPYFALAAISLLMSIGRGLAVAIDVVAEFPRTITIAAGAVADFGRAVLRLDYGVVHQFIDRYVLAAFRVIGLLKPEYDESLETDGQNFTAMRRYDPLC